MRTEPGARRMRAVLRPRPVAYFSAEFDCMSRYRSTPAAWVVLAGDHVKSASDLDIPLIGIGLFYGQGYFLQRLDQSGGRRKSTADGCEPVADAAGHRRKWRTGSGGDCHTRGADPRQVWRVKVAASICCCWTRTSKAMRRKTATRLQGSTDGDARTRIAGAAAGYWRLRA